ncbi:hypothetical protein FKW77_000914 [Venturia effusa]|uniref:Carboxymuconolactone decarboxylase-like domain-containing protein n=1 Tax=Venturia effusa TaxID=50376 RepID=A0A517LN91_9PEZI|nr:hypothetical protein FKW77_000914 [Venturia effusa]
MSLPVTLYNRITHTVKTPRYARLFATSAVFTMRLPYVSDPPNFSSEEDQEIEKRIRERRGARGLIPLDKSLLHSPPVADGWNSFLRAIRTSTTLSASLREAAISRVAILNRAWYEFEHHAPLLLKDGGFPVAGLRYIVSAPPSTKTQSPHVVNESIGIDAQHAAVLSYTDYSTLAVEVPDDIFATIKNTFTDREIVEMTATIGAYNCVSRFLVALDVSESNGDKGMEASLKHVSQELVGIRPASR